MKEAQITPLARFSQGLEQFRGSPLAQQRPFVTLSYAQSLNGSIATTDRRPVALSGHESLVMAHQLRAACDAILVGIGTVLSDNPQLTVRLIAEESPQPVVLDTSLRMPLDAHLLQRTDRPVWIISGPDPSEKKRWRLEQTGAHVFPCAVSNEGTIDLPALLKLLATQDIHSLLVEGGARVLTGFLRARLVDLFVITLAPLLFAGLPAIDHLQVNGSHYILLEHVEYHQLGQDMILWAQPRWNTI